MSLVTHPNLFLSVLPPLLPPFPSRPVPSGSSFADRKFLGEEYLRLLSDISERASLHSLDRGAEKKLGPKEMTRRSAARSGFQMPKEFGVNE